MSEKVCRWILSSGAGQITDLESRTRFFHYSIFIILGIPTILVFGLYHLWLGHYPLGGLIVACGCGLTAGWRYQWRTGQGPFVYRLNALLFAAMLVYALSIGGAEGGKVLWCYTFPLITLFLLGRHEGLLWSCGFLLPILLVFDGSLLSQAGSYPAEFSLRFVLSYLIVSAIAYWFEFLRTKYRIGMEEKARLLEQEKQVLQQNIEQRVQAEAEKDKLIEELRKALEEVDTLRGLLPICSYCHKIRDDEGLWNRIESYLEQRTDVSFSHGICPDCRDKHFPEYSKRPS